MTNTMDIVIRERKAFYCNLKVILIFLVVYGHLIESRIEESEILMWQYRFIYSVHMPLFAFVSGVFLKEKRACILQLKNALKYYIPIQFFVVLTGRLAGVADFSFTVPVWHLWYLLSLACWAWICWVLTFVEKYLNTIMKVMIVLISIGLACWAGETEFIGRELSLSRTIVFLPYVLIGKFLPAEKSFKRYRILGLVLGGLAVIGVMEWEQMIPIRMLYQADSYSVLGITAGLPLRLVCFVLSLGLCTFVLTWIPEKRLPISKVGNDTLWIYILHAPLAVLLRSIPVGNIEFICMAPMIAVLIVCLLYYAYRWKAKLCRIK